jgi:hypothetical protein
MQESVGNCIECCYTEMSGYNTRKVDDLPPTMPQCSQHSPKGPPNTYEAPCVDSQSTGHALDKFGAFSASSYCHTGLYSYFSLICNHVRYFSMSNSENAPGIGISSQAKDIGGL